MQSWITFWLMLSHTQRTTFLSHRTKAAETSSLTTICAKTLSTSRKIHNWADPPKILSYHVRSCKLSQVDSRSELGIYSVIFTQMNQRQQKMQSPCSKLLQKKIGPSTGKSFQPQDRLLTQPKTRFGCKDCLNSHNSKTQKPLVQVKALARHGLGIAS